MVEEVSLEPHLTRGCSRRQPLHSGAPRLRYHGVAACAAEPQGRYEHQLNASGGTSLLQLLANYSTKLFLDRFLPLRHVFP